MESRCRLPTRRDIQLPGGKLLIRRDDLAGYQVVPGFASVEYSTIDSDVRVIAGMEPFLRDGIARLHVSFSHPNRLPDWDTIKQIKQAFFGDNVEAVVVLPKKKHYINRHPYTHHLWESPDFLIED
jgi:hypothetical protein